MCLGHVEVAHVEPHAHGAVVELLNLAGQPLGHGAEGLLKHRALLGRNLCQHLGSGLLPQAHQQALVTGLQRHRHAKVERALKHQALAHGVDGAAHQAQGGLACALRRQFAKALLNAGRHVGGGRAGERAHQNVFGRDLVVNQVAGHQRGEGVGLARPGAGGEREVAGGLKRLRLRF